MAEVRSYGLKELVVGEVATNGALPEDMEALGLTYQDTCDFVQEDDQVQDEFCEEEDDPIESFATRGAKTLKWSTVNLDPIVLQKNFGGAVVNGMWEEPSDTFSREVALKAVTKTDLEIHILRGKLSGKFNLQFRKRGLLKIDWTLKPLKPQVGAALKIGKPTA